MKIFISTLTVLTITIVSTAQINKGAILLEGSMSFNMNETDIDGSGGYSSANQKNTQFGFSPQIGFFINESWQLGVGASYDYYQSKAFNSMSGSTSEVKTTNNTFSLNSYIRKYITLNDKLFLTITGNVGAGLGKSERDFKGNTLGTDEDGDLTTLRVNIGPGLSYFISNKWAITATFGRLYYIFNKEKIDNDFGGYETSTNNFGASFQFNTFGVGVQYLLRNESTVE